MRSAHILWLILHRQGFLLCIILKILNEMHSKYEMKRHYRQSSKRKENFALVSEIDAILIVLILKLNIELIIKRKPPNGCNQFVWSGFGWHIIRASSVQKSSAIFVSLSHEQFVYRNTKKKIWAVFCSASFLMDLIKKFNNIWPVWAPNTSCDHSMISCRTRNTQRNFNSKSFLFIGRKRKRRFFHFFPRSFFILICFHLFFFFFSGLRCDVKVIDGSKDR